MSAPVLKPLGRPHREAIPFAGRVTAIVSASVAPRGLAAGPALVATPVLKDGAVELVLDGGADGERYLVTIVADAGDETLEHELEVAVVDTAWAMPDGGAPMLSIVDFVAAFGIDEVVRMTETDAQRGRIDRALLTSALIFAQSDVEAHLAPRYRLPLATVPVVIRRIIADLARARLYPGGAPDGVAGLAKGATRSLERIADGSLSLGLAEAAAPGEADAPVMSLPGHREYPDRLAGY